MHVISLECCKQDTITKKFNRMVKIQSCVQKDIKRDNCSILYLDSCKIYLSWFPTAKERQL